MERVDLNVESPDPFQVRWWEETRFGVNGNSGQRLVRWKSASVVADVWWRRKEGGLDDESVDIPRDN